MASKDKYLNKQFIKTNNAMLKNSKLKKMKSLMYYVDRNLNLYVHKPKNDSKEKQRVLIVFNLALGDGVVFLCAMKDIRKIYPKNKYILDITCQKGLESIYIKTGLFDNVIPENYTKGTLDIKERYKIIKELNKNYYDLVLDPVGANECFTNVLMTRNIKAKKKVGAIMKNTPCICPKHILKKTYSDIKTIKTSSLIEQYFEFFYDKYEVKYCDLPRENHNLNLPKDYFIVFPSASTELKRWPIDRYAEIVRRIYKKTKLPLVICGTEGDRASFNELEELIKDDDIPIVDIIGKTNLLSFFDVIAKSKLVITNDTSTYHIAVVTETPVAIITGGYTYDRYVLYDFKGNNKYRKPYPIVNKMNCFNCMNNCNVIANGDKTWPCLDKVTTDYAWKIIEKMIDKEVKLK